MTTALDRKLGRMVWPPLLALGLLIAASTVLIFQQRSLASERRHHLQRAHDCRECLTPATE